MNDHSSTIIPGVWDTILAAKTREKIDDEKKKEGKRAGNKKV